MSFFRTALLLCCIIAFSTAQAQTPALDLDGLAPPVAPDVQPELPQAETVRVDGESEQSSTEHELSFWSLLQASGVIGYLIILLSLIAVALIIEYFLLIRRQQLMPAGLALGILQLLSQGKLGEAQEKCEDDSSALAQIVQAGMLQYEYGWDAVEKAAEEMTADQAARLYRKVEYLNVIGNIAPMLGLLGTVVGMVIAFQQMSDSAGYGRAAELAKGIYLALITTVEGLVVAIPCLAAYSFFNNRIATLISETTFVAEQVLHPLKHNLLRKPPVQNRKI